MARITLQHSSINSGNEVVVLGNIVPVYAKQNSKNPNANYSTTGVPVQSVSVENASYQLLMEVRINPIADNAMTLSLLQQFFKLANDPLNPIYLRAELGGGSLVGFSLDSSIIPVTFDGQLQLRSSGKDNYHFSTVATLLETSTP